jgi:hypothetical protein
MAWPKGKPRPPGAGRHKGSRNKKNEAIEAITGAILYDKTYQDNLKKRAVDGLLAPGLEVMLFHYQFGKPVEVQRDDERFVNDLLAIIMKHASSPDALHEIQEAVNAYRASGATLRAVA